MEEIRFQWDENKNSINKKKHKVSFEEAATVFYDEEALMIPDTEHSEQEERFLVLGESTSQICLLSVTVIVSQKQSYALFPHEKQQKQRNVSILTDYEVIL